MRRTSVRLITSAVLALTAIAGFASRSDAVNAAPTAPTTVSPVDGGYVTAGAVPGTVQLAAAGAIDPEGGAITYRFTVSIRDQYGADAPIWQSAWTPTQAVLGQAQFAAVNAPVGSGVLGGSLRIGMRYTLRVEARDPVGLVGPAKTQWFDVFSSYQPGPAPASYTAPVDLAPFGARSWANAGITDLSTNYLQTNIANLTITDCGGSTLLTNLTKKIRQINLPFMAPDTLSTSNGFVRMLDPVAQSAAAITHEILVKEPALYTNLYTDGGFNCRVSPVSGTISNHSWGTAIDIRVRNAAYEFGRNSVVTMALLRAYGYFHANGWWWGFGWGDPFEDNMHFQPGQVVLDYFRTVKAVTKTL